jgi:hypothetical protein
MTRHGGPAGATAVAVRRTPAPRYPLFPQWISVGGSLEAMAEDALTTEEFARWWRETGEHELRQLLLWRWDPIGVADYFPNSADEYDGYAPQVVQVLRQGGDAAAVAGHLLEVERQSMDGPLTPPQRLEYLGSLICDWYESSQNSWADFGPVRR